jgi:hypothetical protein
MENNMAMKYALHREYIEKMLRDEMANGISRDELPDFESLIDELREDGYLERNVAVDLQQLLIARD